LGGAAQFEKRQRDTKKKTKASIGIRSLIKVLIEGTT